MRALPIAGALTLFAGSLAPAQSLPRRIGAAGDGRVAFSFAARDGVCGDGATLLRDGFGGGVIIDSDPGGDRRHWNSTFCRHGPVRVVAMARGGEVVRLRTHAGSPDADDEARSLGEVPVREAVSWLSELAAHATGRVASDAILPLVLADSTNHWPMLLRLARDDDRPKAVRREAGMWLGRASAARLRLTIDDEEKSPDAEVREAAVFGLSQLPRERAIPQLLNVARTARHPDARASALFWLGMSGDERALELFEEILR